MVSVNLNSRSWKHIFWLIGACAFVFGLPFISLFIIKMNVDLFYLFFLAAGAIFLWYYKKRSMLKIAVAVKSGWAFGIILALFVGLSFISIKLTATSASASPIVPAGPAILIWRGVVYGIISSLLISVLPFVTVWRSFAGGNPGILRKTAIFFIAIFSILLTSTSYSLGISGFDREKINYNITMNFAAAIPTLISGNPLASPIAGAFLQISQNMIKDDTALAKKDSEEIY